MTKAAKLMQKLCDDYQDDEAGWEAFLNDLKGCQEKLQDLNTHYAKCISNNSVPRDRSLVQDAQASSSAVRVTESVDIVMQDEQV